MTQTFEQYLENRSDREKLQDEYIDRVIDGMDMKTLVQYAYDSLHEYYSDMTDAELTEQVAAHFPDLLENQ